jgi:2-hydroxy-3-oxopropionate reductase
MLAHRFPDMAAQLSIGFIGTGIMGKPMARNLLAAGFPVTVWNRTPAKYAELLAAGARAAKSPADLAAESDVVIAMLMEWSQLEALALGPGGFIEVMRPGSLFIDMATDPPANARALAAYCALRGIAVLDAPVSGGERGATDGSLAIMAGGTQEAFDLARPVLDAMGKNVVLVGPAGCGQVAKACNQLIVAVTIEAVAEALALAKAAGADPAMVRKAMMGGFATSRILEEHGARMLARNWLLGGPLSAHLKDRANVYEVAEAADLELPAARAVFERINEFVERGGGNLDHSALYELLDPA